MLLKLIWQVRKLCLCPRWDLSPVFMPKPTLSRSTTGGGLGHPQAQQEWTLILGLAMLHVLMCLVFTQECLFWGKSLSRKPWGFLYACYTSVKVFLKKQKQKQNAP